MRTWKVLLWAFLSVELVLYIAFMSIDVFGGNSFVSENLKYTGIILCVLFAVGIYVNKRNINSLLVASGLIFTAIADAFLLKSTVYLPGVVSFCVVQTIYYYLIIRNGTDGKDTKGPIFRTFSHILTAGVFAFVIGLMLKDYAGDDFLLMCFAAYYAFSFLKNIVTGIGMLVRQYIAKNTAISYGFSMRRFVIGLIIFALCDINVLLYNLPGYIGITSKLLLILLKFAGDFMWMFYLPSQVLIAHSCYCFSNRNR